MRRARTACLLVTGAVLLTAAPAGAQVVVDPDSPSGKEYAIPLESARRQAAPAPKPKAEVVQGARTSPLFGEGVGDGTAKGAGDATAKGKRVREKGRAPDPQTAAQDNLSDSARATVRAAASRPGAPASGIGTPLLVALGAAGLLAAGAGAGWALRRRASR
jgi:hypothetical protein